MLRYLQQNPRKYIDFHKIEKSGLCKAKKILEVDDGVEDNDSDEYYIDAAYKDADTGTDEWEEYMRKFVKESNERYRKEFEVYGKRVKRKEVDGDGDEIGPDEESAYGSDDDEYVTTPVTQQQYEYEQDIKAENEARDASDGCPNEVTEWYWE